VARGTPEGRRSQLKERERPAVKHGFYGFKRRAILKERELRDEKGEIQGETWARNKELQGIKSPNREKAGESWGLGIQGGRAE